MTSAEARKVLQSCGAVLVDDVLAAVATGADKSVHSVTTRSAEGILYQVIVAGVTIWSHFVELSLRSQWKIARVAGDECEVSFAMLALIEECT